MKYGEDLKDDCPICVLSKTLTGFYEDHAEFEGLTGVKAKVHEVFASIKDFDYANKNYIGEMIEYIRSREALKSKVPFGFGKQSSLSDF